jgi:hypothetical protein
MSAIIFDANQRIITSNNAINSISNGLPFDSSGALVVNDAITAPSTISGGIPFASNQSVAVDSVTAAAGIQNGIPFTAAGRIAVDSFNAINNFQNELPLTTSKLSVTDGGLWYGDDLALNSINPTYVADFLNSRYYNSVSGVTAFPFTAVRTTNATMFDALGRLVWAPANLLLNSATLNTQSVTVLSGAPYTLSFTGTGTVALSGGATGSLVGTGASSRVSLNFTTTTTSVTFTVTGSVTLAQLELTDINSPNTYNATTGTAFFGARFDYYPNAGGVRGIMVEDSRTNDIPNGAGAAAIAAVAAASDTAGGTYLGSWAFRRFTANGASAVHSASSGNVTPSATQLRRVCVVARATAGATRLQVSTSINHALNTAYVNINMTTGAVLATGAGASNVTVVALGGGLFRICFDYTSIGVPAAGPGVELFTITSDADTRAPTNTSTDVFDVLFFENCAGSGSQSIIPTFGAAVTRGADTLQITPLPAWFNQAQGTYFFALEHNNDVSNTKRLLSINDGTANNMIQVQKSVTNTFAVTTILAGASDFSPSAGGASTNFAVVKTALRANSPAKALAFNATAVGTASVAFPNSGLTLMRLGNRLGDLYLNGWIREFRYYSDASASNAQLQALTT